MAKYLLKSQVDAQLKISGLPSGVKIVSYKGVPFEAHDPRDIAHLDARCAREKRIERVDGVKKEKPKPAKKKVAKAKVE